MLNEDFLFVNAEKKVKRAFNGIPEKILLRSGVRLYKRTDRPLIGKNGISPWWCLLEDTRLPSGIIVDGLRKSRMLADRLGKSHRDYLRVRAAVAESFPNSMMHLLLVELTASVWGFAGVAMGQREFEDEELSHIYLIGGAHQVWIPNLTAAHVSEIRTAI